MRKPLIAVTMGDPGGIGAEVIVKALADPQVRKLGRFIVYGLHEMLTYAADQAEIAPYWFRLHHDEIDEVRSGVVVADFDELPATFSRNATPEGGFASERFLSEAVTANKARFVNAIVTAPINKTSWKMAKVRFPGHTEYLADAYRCRRVTMAFVGGAMRIALASSHTGLFSLRNSFTIGRVFQPIDLLDDWLRRSMGIEEPRIAVCGLNPHAGEDGQFGDEEKRIIEPAMVMAGEVGIKVEGPFPADTLFIDAAKGKYDGVVAMYHDQGLIPIKLLHFDSAVNVTLGLPVIRTSVDHGTAYNIAGKNRANEGSMKAALKLACQLATTPMAAATKHAKSQTKDRKLIEAKDPVGEDKGGSPKA
ncbi:MAG: 4-hydroxythreonine-4-phosphate dehydrogenase PdxA [Planctomycetes bacterium]|nr:4-hydroxythreonine-4-phosphate dehydrogenase PdxA [Planctomycetota bacterium]